MLLNIRWLKETKTDPRHTHGGFGSGSAASPTAAGVAEGTWGSCRWRARARPGPAIFLLLDSVPSGPRGAALDSSASAAPLLVCGASPRPPSTGRPARAPRRLVPAVGSRPFSLLRPPPAAFLREHRGQRPLSLGTSSPGSRCPAWRPGGRSCLSQARLPPFGPVCLLPSESKRRPSLK